MPQGNQKIMDLPTLMKYISEQRAKGLSDYKIVETLISNGYNSSQIYDALTQLDLKQSMKVPISGSKTNEPLQPKTENIEQAQAPVKQPQSVNQQQVTASNVEENNSINQTSEQINNNVQENAGLENQTSEQTNSFVNQEVIATQSSQISPELIEKVQEISETIIEEKWDELIGNVKKIVDWKNRMEERINKISERMDVLEKEMSDLRNSIFSKIKDYDTHISEFSTDLKALQKVFGDMLPEFVSGIHQLKEIIDKAKKE